MSSVESKYSEPIRQSTWVLISKLFLTMFLMDLFYLLIRILFFDLRLDWLPNRDMSLIFILFLSTLYVIEIPTIILIVLRWISTFHYVNGDKITLHKGIFVIEERSYNLKDIKKIFISQKLIGRLFNFGTLKITIAAPSINEELTLHLISKPREIEAKLKIYP